MLAADKALPPAASPGRAVPDYLITVGLLYYASSIGAERPINNLFTQNWLRVIYDSYQKTYLQPS